MNSSSFSRQCLGLLTFSLLLVPVMASASPPITLALMESKQTETLSNQQKAEKFVDLLIAGQYSQARALLYPDLQSQWSPAAIEQIWLELQQTTGPAQKRLSSRSTESVGAELVFVEVQFEKTTDKLLVIFNQNQEIVGVDFPRAESIEEIAQKVVDALVAGDFASARGYLHPYLKTELFPQQIEQKWERLLEQTGPYQKTVGVEVKQGSEIDNVSVVLVTMEFAKVTEPLIIIFNDQKQIIGVDFPIID